MCLFTDVNDITRILHTYTDIYFHLFNIIYFKNKLFYSYFIHFIFMYWAMLWLLNLLSYFHSYFLGLGAFLRENLSIRMSLDGYWFVFTAIKPVLEFFSSLLVSSPAYHDNSILKGRRGGGGGEGVFKQNFSQPTFYFLVKSYTYLP